MSTPPRWPVAVFDLDGTLCDTVALIVASYQHAHREVLGVELSEAEVLPWIGRTLVDVYAAWPEQAAALEASYLAFNLAHLEELQTNVGGIPELLDDLLAAGVHIGVATSKRRESARRSLAAAGIEQKVPIACAMEDTAEHKPSPQPLRHALLQLGAGQAVPDAAPGGEPDGAPLDAALHAVYVGDALVDVAAAKAAGMAQLAVTWGAGDRTELMLAEPTAVCDSVDDLRRWLLGPVG